MSAMPAVPGESDFERVERDAEDAGAVTSPSVPSYYTAEALYPNPTRLLLLLAAVDPTVHEPSHAYHIYPNNHG